ncbi:hypothetical protein CBR_g34534 [Chara braunii]|uniref:Cyclic nucleotide-binding domain-containing protein n=1 Tax=Chara braunii TaxID=69332 RepID=A0A388LJ24_CHABU|nr:hypothetical protein CBR_g34534 [Chara braunii]|eukprot:GBG82251.1 hypothetical protein CBR_g34534 [Chara braunii]
MEMQVAPAPAGSSNEGKGVVSVSTTGASLEEHLDGMELRGTFSFTKKSAGGNRPVRQDISRARRRVIEGINHSAESEKPWVPRTDLPPKTAEQKKKILGAVASNFLFAHLSEKQIDDLINCMEQIYVKSGNIIIRQKSGEADEAYQARMLLLITEAKQRSDAVEAAAKQMAEDAEKTRLLAIEQQRQHDEAATKAADEERVQHREKIFSGEQALLTMAADWRAEAENGKMEESENKIALLLSHLTDLLATCITQQEDIHSLNDVLSRVHNRHRQLEQRPVAAPDANSSNNSDRLEALEIDVGSLKDGVQSQQTATQQLEQRICTAANHSSSRSKVRWAGDFLRLDEDRPDSMVPQV